MTGRQSRGGAWERVGPIPVRAVPQGLQEEDRDLVRLMTETEERNWWGSRVAAADEEAQSAWQARLGPGSLSRWGAWAWGMRYFQDRVPDITLTSFHKKRPSPRRATDPRSARAALRQLRQLYQERAVRSQRPTTTLDSTTALFGEGDSSCPSPRRWRRITTETEVEVSPPSRVHFAATPDIHPIPTRGEVGVREETAQGMMSLEDAEQEVKREGVGETRRVQPVRQGNRGSSSLPIELSSDSSDDAPPRRASQRRRRPAPTEEGGDQEEGHVVRRQRTGNGAGGSSRIPNDVGELGRSEETTRTEGENRLEVGGSPPSSPRGQVSCLLPATRLGDSEFCPASPDITSPVSTASGSPSPLAAATETGESPTTSPVAPNTLPPTLENQRESVQRQRSRGTRRSRMRGGVERQPLEGTEGRVLVPEASVRGEHPRFVPHPDDGSYREVWRGLMLRRVGANPVPLSSAMDDEDPISAPASDDEQLAMRMLEMEQYRSRPRARGGSRRLVTMSNPVTNLLRSFTEEVPSPTWRRIYRGVASEWLPSP